MVPLELKSILCMFSVILEGKGACVNNVIITMDTTASEETIFNVATINIDHSATSVTLLLINYSLLTIDIAFTREFRCRGRSRMQAV